MGSHAILKEHDTLNYIWPIIVSLAERVYTSRLIGRNPDLLMHGGGTEILRYYKRFRYIKNVYLDLSYTAQHFIKTSLKQDIYFLIKNFDRRLIIGTDYPTKKILEYIDLNKLLKKEITNYKINNIFLGNLKKIENELQKKN